MHWDADTWGHLVELRRDACLFCMARCAYIFRNFEVQRGVLNFHSNFEKSWARSTPQILKPLPYCCSARRPGHPRSVTASPAFSCLIGILCLVFFLRLIHLRTSCLINLSASHVFAFLHAAPRAGPSKQRARRLVRTLPSQRRWRFRQRRASWCMQQCHMCKCCFWGGSLHGARRAAKAGRGGAP